MRQNVIKNFMLTLISPSIVLYRFEVMREVAVFLQRSAFKFGFYRLKFSHVMQKYLACVIVLRYDVLAYFNVYHFGLFCVLFC